MHRVHLECGKGRNEAYVPSQPMHIGTSGDLWRLQLTEELTSPEDRHISLSYLWGNYQQLLLDTSNIDQLRAGLAIPESPKIFRDTVHIVRMLFFHYIWIDTLCIVQDSAEDWRYESTRMRNLYRARTAPLPPPGLPTRPATFSTSVTLEEFDLLSYTQHGSVTYTLTSAENA